MDKKENQRIALTKRLVQEALLLLLQRKSIYQISIRELCEKAGINRSTFYNHYGSQYDVLAEMAQAYLVSIENAIGAVNIRDKQSVLQRVTLVFQHIADNIELSKMLINNNIDATFSERLFSLPKIEELLNNALSEMQDENEKQAVISFAIHGSYKLLQDWINTDDRPSPEAQAKCILTLAGKVCRWDR